MENKDKIVETIDLQQYLKLQQEENEKHISEGILKLTSKNKISLKAALSFLYGPGVDSWNRFYAFHSLCMECIFSGIDLSDKVFTKLFIHSYTDTDNLFHAKNIIKELLNECNFNSEYAMNKSEKKVFDSLPEKVTIYRGMTKQEFDSKQFGISWTLDKKKAEFFAFEYRRNYDTENMEKLVHEEIINKDQILCYLDGRKEKEILVIFK